MTRNRPILLSLFIVVLAACNTGGGTTGTASSPEAPAAEKPAAGGDSCRFATAEEVSAAVGVEVAETTPSGDTCTYKNAEGGGLLIYAYVKQGGKSAFENQRGADGAEEVGGIGDGALWFSQGGMYVLKGDAILNMTILGNAALGEDKAALRTALEKVARAAAGRM